MLFSEAYNIKDDVFVPLFGDINSITTHNETISSMLMTLSRRTGLSDVLVEYEECCRFLYTTVVGGSGGNAVPKVNSFKNYRSEINKFLNWAWLVKKQPITSLRRSDMLEFVAFCASPPESLITTAAFSWFDAKGDINPKWKPFTAKAGTSYVRKASAVETQLSVLSSLYDHFIEEEYDTTNPAKQAKKKMRFQTSSEHSSMTGIDDIGRAFSVEQWDTIWQATEQLASDEPEKHERTRLIMLMLYWMYLRISEVSYRPGFAPYMGHFFRHPENNDLWIFHVPNSKGGKKRSIGVPKPVLEGLKRYRQFRGLTALPVSDEMVPLFPRHVAANHGRAKGKLDEPIGIDAVYETVKTVYSRAADMLMERGRDYDAEFVRNGVVHMLRHTGITHDLDVRHRKIELVSRDAGHSSTQVTNIYVSKDTLERYMDSFEKANF
ncbi:site-specific integrase [Vibrio tubiashii]|uniref:tyrosine-type recombinase/integrase n=1 Tax=Vibrio tubiashii TaxID=29498 RepID=UPI001EFC7B62|nr:site-specific integrase [Vibrio tubiashii]MCG9576662.1 site-specific integrase [Vibrio tubiashii]